MVEDFNKLREYKNDFFQPYNFTIKSDEYYIYRYFKSFHRLEEFLEKGIYLSPATEFTDGLECVDKETIVQVNKWQNYQELWEENNPHVSPFELSKLKEEANNNLRKLAISIAEMQKKYFISCWYLPDKSHENELMWNSYSHLDEYGFLIKIKLKDFLEHLEQSMFLNEDKGKLIYGIVQYFDFNKEENIKKIKYTAFRKHNSFSDERELRLVIKDYSSRLVPPMYLKLNKSFYQDISVFVSPRASYDDYVEIRKKVIDKFEIDLHQSELSVWYNLKCYLNKISE